MGELLYQKDDIIFLRSPAGNNYIGVIESDDGFRVNVRWWVDGILYEAESYGRRDLMTKIGSLKMLDLSLSDLI